MEEKPVLKKRAVEVCKKGLDFGSFTIIKVLLNDTKSKKIHVHGRFKDSEEDTIILLEKPPFSEDSIHNILSSETHTSEEFSNDVYSQHTAMPQPFYNTIAAQIIRPATSNHINKYTYQKLKVVEESPDSYQKITLPYVMENSLHVEWVYNILNHKSETERIIYEDSDPETGFILLPDIKWDGKQVESLYVCAIVQNRNIKSIRDLNEKHLPLLKNLLTKGLEEIVKKYSVSSDEIRAYLHYYPSYYHLHVHYNHLQADVGGISAEKAHLLTNIIDNIENIASDYYQKKTLTVLLREQDPLLSLLTNNKV